VAERATATVAADDLGLGPANVLSVNEVDGGIWLRLEKSVIVPFIASAIDCAIALTKS
jgi:hypothetical protein